MDGVRRPTREHKKPRHLGGSSGPTNLIAVCSPCNGEKGGRTLEQFANYLTDRGDPRAQIVWNLLDAR